MFEFTTWHASFPDFFISLRHYTVTGKQLLLSNDKNRVRGAVLGLSQDGASTNLFENFRENSLKRDLSNDTTANTPLSHWPIVPLKKIWPELPVCNSAVQFGKNIKAQQTTTLLVLVLVIVLVLVTSFLSDDKNSLLILLL